MRFLLAVLLAALFATTLAAQTITPAQTPNGVYTTTGALKGNGSGVVSQAACADLSNGATAVVGHNLSLGLHFAF